MKTLTLFILSLSLFLSACDDPAANKARAVTSDASTSNTTQPADPSSDKGETLPISPENSKVLFTGSKVTGRHDGGFNKFSGRIYLVNERPEDSRVLIEIDAASVFSDDNGLTKHLQSGDFFDSAKYPNATFASTSIVPDAAAGAGKYTVTGDLELRGQKKSVTFPASIAVGADEVAVDADFSINRKDFGIVYAGKADDLIRDDVVIKLDLNSPRKK